MNEPTPPVRAIIAEVSEAIRRDHRRRTRRRHVLRTAGFGSLGLVGISTAALAAGGAFREVETVTPVGEVELPQSVTIQAVDSFPEFVGTASPSGFVTRTPDAKWGSYFYHVTGGQAPELGCGYATVPTNNVYITSKRPLSEQEIRSLLKPDGEEETRKRRPPWITSTSDGCANPGIAGQPGTAEEPPRPGKAAVTTPTSTTTRILIRTQTRVPITPPATTTPTTSTTPTPTTTATPTTTTTAAPIPAPAPPTSTSSPSEESNTPTSTTSIPSSTPPTANTSTPTG